MTMICNAIVISRIQYALSSWGGFLTADIACQINSVFKRLFQYGSSNRIFNFQSLLDTSDNRFFNQIHNEVHCLNHLLPPIKVQPHELERLGNPYALPASTSSLTRKSVDTQNYNFELLCICLFILFH